MNVNKTVLFVYLSRGKNATAWSNYRKEKEMAESTNNNNIVATIVILVPNMDHSGWYDLDSPLDGLVLV